MANWRLLAQHLGRVATTETLTWEQLADLVGALPASASEYRAWWSGDRSHVRVWRSAGFVATDVRLGRSVTFVRAEEGRQLVSAAPAAGDSAEQRRVESLMLELLSGRLGQELVPKRLTAPSGAYIDVDGVSADGSVLVECWAHQGPAKVAQKYKLINDAAKLRWASTWLQPPPQRLLLCVSDEQAVRHLRGRSWQGEAIREMSVEIEVVALREEDVSALVDAQTRQYR